MTARSLEVREQASLPFRRMLEVCLDSISYRLLRSAVTVVIIVLAIAFLATIMVEGYLGRAIRDTVTGKTRRLTAFSGFLSKVSNVDPPERLTAALALLQPGAADYRNLVRWGEFSGEAGDDVRAFLVQARAAAQYLGFFDEIQSGRRALLVGEHKGVDIFEWLQTPENLAEFGQRLDEMKSVRLPGGWNQFQAFLKEWPAYREKLTRLSANYLAATQRIAAFALPEGLGSKLLAAVAAGRQEEFFGRLEALGFSVDSSMFPDIIAGAEYKQREEWASQVLDQSAVRTGWNPHFHETFGIISALRSVAASPRRVNWIEETLAKGEEGTAGAAKVAVAPAFDRDKFLQTARDCDYLTGLLEDETRLLNRYGASEKLSDKTVWLIVVSFLVCVVGIANAMLMSVLERFKEIATMKCLGARNQTIGFLFVTESTIMGVVGGVIGIITGALIVLLRQGIQYGGLMFERFPVVNILLTMGICFACSLVLATVAAIYPAYVAARMAPMEAMRVD